MKQNTDEMSENEYYAKQKSAFLETNEEQKIRIQKIRDTFEHTYKIIYDLCKEGREQSLVFTKLEEAQFWAIKGITREK